MIWVNLSVQQIMGDAACDLRFGKFIEGGRKGAREREVEWEK